MKTFILGGKGFVGSAFVRFCQQRGTDCAAIDLDNYAEWRGKECGILINAAGNSKKFLAEKDPWEDFNLSVLSVLNSFRDFHFQRYVYISSVDVYPDCSHPDNNREDVAIAIERQTRYGFHKYLSEMLIRRHLPNWLIIRLGGVLGPGLKKNPVFDLLHNLPLRVDERSEYQYLPTDLVAETVFRLVEQEFECQIFNLCGRGTVTLKEIRSWLKIPLVYQPGPLRRERYEVNTEKIGKYFEMPHSREVARNFLLLNPK